MSTLWSWPEISHALSNQKECGPDVQRVAFDSRQVVSGDLFFALAGDPGQRFNPSSRSAIDGHDFLRDAQANGAVGAVVGVPVALDLERPWRHGRGVDRLRETEPEAVVGQRDAFDLERRDAVARARGAEVGPIAS